MKGGENYDQKIKCLSCPYFRKLIKCVKSPCPECLASGSAKNPFGDIIFKESKSKKDKTNK